MITTIAFTVYPVRDMARSRSFYEGILGLTLGSNFQDVWIEYELGDSTFAITTTDMGHTPGAKGAVVAVDVPIYPESMTGKREGNSQDSACDKDGFPDVPG